LKNVHPMSSSGFLRSSIKRLHEKCRDRSQLGLFIVVD
jgi:hypothetical protein